MVTTVVLIIFSIRRTVMLIILAIHATDVPIIFTIRTTVDRITPGREENSNFYPQSIYIIPAVHGYKFSSPCE